MSIKPKKKNRNQCLQNRDEIIKLLPTHILHRKYRISGRHKVDKLINNLQKRIHEVATVYTNGIHTKMNHASRFYNEFQDELLLKTFFKLF